jgi:Fuc2NAc and GlcNAc transferase
VTPVTLGLVGLAIVGSWWLTGVVRRYALARSVLDLPNERSSHVVPTPRGGGLAIALVGLGGVAASWGVGMLLTDVAAALVGGGTAIAAIGWADDRLDLPASWRALVQLAAAAWAVWCLGGLPALSSGAASVSLGGAGSLLAVVGIVWCTNLYNFMDGIDGIAASQAVVAGLAGAGLLAATGLGGLALVPLLMAAGAAGFLVWNWSPAKIFMGDIGSSLLGYMFATIAVASENLGGLPVLGWSLLLGVFIVDATVTLVRRIVRGERWYAAHRSHAYQRLVQAGISHAGVTSRVIGINCLLATLVGAASLGWASWTAASGVTLATLAAAYVYVERRRPMYGASSQLEGGRS